MEFFPIPGAKLNYKLGDIGFGVAAVETNLFVPSPTGIFDKRLDVLVRTFQSKRHLVVDGEVGPKTQQQLAVQYMGPARQKYGLPAGLLASITKLESNYFVAATNWRSKGYVDLGWVQIRTPYYSKTTNYLQVVNGIHCYNYAGSLLKNRYMSYMGFGKVTTRRAWEIAVLAHNWPVGAANLARGIPLSTEPAQWVIDIGAKGITTPAQWAEHYISLATSLVDWNSI